MMNLELDHFFILTDKPKETGDLLVAIGMNESFSRDHKGQGTSNRRFKFSNGMLELLYIRNCEEANNGPANNLRFPERIKNEKASPFGVILTRKNNSNLEMPFRGWKYQPKYFEPPKSFHIGENSEILEEPLCIYAPFIEPIDRQEETGEFKSISGIRVSVPLDKISDTLSAVQTADRLQVELGNEHLVKLTLDTGNRGLSKDFRPDLPLIIHW